MPLQPPPPLRTTETSGRKRQANTSGRSPTCRIVTRDRIPRTIEQLCLAWLHASLESTMPHRAPDRLTRVWRAGGAASILYFFHGKDIAVLAHGLTKEDRVSDADMDRAVKRKLALELNPERHIHEEGDHGKEEDH